MTDPRTEKLAQILVNYSTRVKPGDWVHIESDLAALPLVRAVYAAVLAAGGHLTTDIGTYDLREVLYPHANESQLQWVSPLEMHAIKEVNVSIFLTAPGNTRALSNVPPERQQMRQKAYREWVDIYMQRTATHDLRWVIANFPCPALAQDAEMSLEEFENFVYQATYADQDDPVACWQKMQADQERLVNWLTGKEAVVILSPHADLSLSIQGRTFLKCAGEVNMPDGEIYTSPVETSVNGWVDFTYPAIMGGRSVEGVHLEFKDGLVVKASAQKNEDFLHKMLEVDEGARRVGELGIGTNQAIQRFTRSILYDEKIGGSFHLALGGGFPEAGGTNQSSIHWDMICDLHHDSEIRVDGELFSKDGEFCV